MILSPNLASVVCSSTAEKTADEGARGAVCDVCGEPEHPSEEDAWTLTDKEWFRHYGMCGSCGRSDCPCGGCIEDYCTRCPERVEVTP